MEVLEKIDLFADQTIAEFRVMNPDDYIKGLEIFTVTVNETREAITRMLLKRMPSRDIAANMAMSAINAQELQHQIPLDLAYKELTKEERDDAYKMMHASWMAIRFFKFLAKELSPSPVDLRLLFPNDNFAYRVAGLLQNIKKGGGKYLNGKIACAVIVSSEVRSGKYDHEETFVFFAKFIGHELSAFSTYEESSKSKIFKRLQAQYLSELNKDRRMTVDDLFLPKAKKGKT